MSMVFSFCNNSPHTSQKLDQTTISKSGADDNTRARDSASSQVDQRQDEGGQGESGETERRGVGELALLR